MSKLEKEIKKFFDFVFNDDVYVEDLENGIVNVDFKNLVAKRDSIVNAARIKKVLNFYLSYNGVPFEKFRINFLGLKDKQEYDEI